MREYDGPKHERITRKLRKIAKSYGMKIRFKPRVGFSGEYWVGMNTAAVQLDNTARIVISTFFHELGHHIDYKAGLYKNFYNLWIDSTPLYKARKISLKAERHADMIGQKLCKKYFPKVKYDRSYRSKEDITYNRWYYADGRTNLKKFLTTLI